jgi:uncharacterized repeat protein (TIGR04076 family)
MPADREGPWTVRVTMVEQRGTCRHQLGDRFEYSYSPLYPPRELCPALALSMSPYVAMKAVGGVPWWDEGRGDDDSFYISCISRSGTVWRIEQTNRRIPFYDVDQARERIKENRGMHGVNSPHVTLEEGGGRL